MFWMERRRITGRGRGLGLGAGDRPEAGEEAQPLPRPLPVFLSRPGFATEPPFQQEPSLSQPKGFSRKPSLGSPGTRKQSTSWMKPSRLPAVEQQKGSGLLPVPGALCHLNTFPWLLLPQNRRQEASDTGQRGSENTDLCPRGRSQQEKPAFTAEV